MARGRKSSSNDSTTKLKLDDYGDDLPKDLYLEETYDFSKLEGYSYDVVGTYFVDGKCMKKVVLLKKK